ncbi:MAG: PadR family transcriptional regulator [Candidatus Roizmanbacteria bacterium]|nr:PadR family transcriptional regulator [Candidatus Roizmanbacteria bacterium]
MRTNCSRVIVENFFEPCTLYLLLQKPSYGYELLKNLKEHCSCEVNIGNLYRSLSRMQKQGYVKREATKSTVGPQRYAYTITTLGKTYLSSWIGELEKQQKIIHALIINYKKSL